MPPLRLRPPSSLHLHLPRSLPLTPTPLHHNRTLTTLPYIPTCPPSTCTCAPTPDLDIDRKIPLLNTMAQYAQHIVVCSGKSDWASKIEDEETGAGAFVRGLKSVVGGGRWKKGVRFDPFNNIVTTLSSFPNSNASPSTPTTDVLLFPSFQRLSSLPHDTHSLANLSAAYLSAPTLHPFHASAALAPEQISNLVRDPSRADTLPNPTPITKPVILICGHGGRDARCGILGPLLKQGFEEELKRRGIEGDVGVCSHVGGHKFAGNVIIYLPPSPSAPQALSGTGIWYGRVGPSNVEGIVSETVIGGRVIADLFRGGISQEGQNLGHVLEAQLKRERGEDEEVEGALRIRPRARGSA